MRNAWRIEKLRLLSKIAKHLEALQVLLELRNKFEKTQPVDDQSKQTQNHPSAKDRGILTPKESLVGQIEDPKAANDQHKWNVRRFWLDIYLAAILTATLIFVGLQWQSMNDTLKEMQQQTKPLIEAANAAREAAVEARMGREQDAEQNRVAIDAQIDASRLDQRAWVGIAEVVTSGAFEDIREETFHFQSLQIIIQNSGRSPARNLNGWWIVRQVPWTEPIPDYAVVIKEDEAVRIKTIERLQQAAEETITRYPQLEDTMRAMTDMTNRLLFPKGGSVVAPSATQEIEFLIQKDWPIHLESKKFAEHFTAKVPGTIYVLGKITYNDIFPGTPVRNTKFCLMRRIQDPDFRLCPENNWMD